MSAPGDQDLQQHRAYLLRYADAAAARPGAGGRRGAGDAARRARGPRAFAGKSSHKTWLTGILKHKIIDLMRAQIARAAAGTATDDESEADAIDAMFREDGHWQQLPATWGNPEKALEDRKFWAVFEMCSHLMPERTARVFMMREVMELSTEEICQELAITPTNLWVMLHRARLSLRECLEIKWFGGRAR